jgi:hypothetical protein
MNLIVLNKYKSLNNLLILPKKEFLKSFPGYNGAAENDAELIEVLRSFKDQKTALKN